MAKSSIKTGTLGGREKLRAAIQNGTYERLGLSERPQDTNPYLGRVPNFGATRGKARRGKRSY